MSRMWNRIKAPPQQDYAPLPLNEKETPPASKQRQSSQSPLKWLGVILSLAGTGLALYGIVNSFASSNEPCDTIDHGYRCSPKTSHFWGQYSLWFSVPSETDVEPPKGCSVSFASVLSRHGGRDPTLGKSIAYNALITYIKNSSEAFPDEFAFLKEYNYQFGADELTDAGRQEMVNSGAHFYRRYESFIKGKRPFVRSAGQHRVVESAEKWLQGFADAAQSKPGNIDVTIPEGSDFNNTLSHDNCPAFDNGPWKDLNDEAQNTWRDSFVPPIQKRVNGRLPGVELTAEQIVYLMDICSFDTLAHSNAKISPFCHIFTEDEWHAYDYYQSLGKYYGYSNGNPIGPTQGVGYVTELLSRLTEQPVKDDTNTNHTLNSDAATFPLDRKLYADFSHDNDISGNLAALGLYNKTQPLSNTTMQTAKESHGYSAAWTVPFASRMYVEKLQCQGTKEEFVRIIVNDRVMPLEFCDGDIYGRCTLSNFVESQAFARSGGKWHLCNAETSGQ